METILQNFHFYRVQIWRARVQGSERHP